MKNKILITLSLLAACSLGFAPVTSLAAEKEKEKKGAAVAADSTRPIPYNGKVTKVDEKGKAFTLSGSSGRVLHTTETTKFKKDGGPATLADVKPGEEVRGQATKAGDTWTAVSVTIGAKEKAADKKGGTTEATDKPATAKEGTAPIKGAHEPAGKPAAAGVGTTTGPDSGAGSPNSSSAGPAVNGVPQPGGQAPAGAKKN